MSHSVRRTASLLRVPTATCIAAAGMGTRAAYTLTEKWPDLRPSVGAVPRQSHLPGATCGGAAAAVDRHARVQGELSLEPVADVLLGDGVARFGRAHAPGCKVAVVAQRLDRLRRLGAGHGARHEGERDGRATV